MTAQASFFDAPRESAEVERLRARVQQIEAELAALKKPAKPKPPFRIRQVHLDLMDVLRDGRWHPWGTLRRAGGTRFAARLKEAADAGWLTYEWRHRDETGATEYRGQIAQVAP